MVQSCAARIEEIIREKGMVTREDVVKLLAQDYAKSTIYYNLKSLTKRREPSPILHHLNIRLLREIIGLNPLNVKAELMGKTKPFAAYILWRDGLQKILDESAHSRFQFEIKPQINHLYATVDVKCTAKVYAENCKVKVQVLPSDASLTPYPSEVDVLWHPEKTHTVDFNPGECKVIPLIHVKPSEECEKEVDLYQRALEDWKKTGASQNAIQHVSRKLSRAETALRLSIHPHLINLADEKLSNLLTQILMQEKIVIFALTIYSREPPPNHAPFMLGYDLKTNKQKQPIYYSIKLYEIVGSIKT